MTTTTLAPALDANAGYVGPTLLVWPPTTFSFGATAPSVGQLIRGFHVGTLPYATTYLLSFDTAALSLPQDFTVSLVLTPASTPTPLLGSSVAIDDQPWGEAPGIEECPVDRAAPHLATYLVADLVAETPVTFSLPASAINRIGRTELAVSLQGGSTPSGAGNKDVVNFYSLATPAKAPYLSFVLPDSDELEKILNRVVELQKALGTPTGENKGIGQNAFDDWPSTFPFPCFVNIWDGTPEIERGPARRRQTIMINMHLLFASASQKYSDRSRRRWIRATLNAFDTDLRLGNTCHLARIEAVEADPVEVNGVAYIAATFRLNVTYDEAFAFAS